WAQGALLGLFNEGKVVQEGAVGRAVEEALLVPASGWGALRTRLLEAYRGLDETEGYAFGYWKNICRPMLQLDLAHQIACAWRRGGLCEGCRPGAVMSFPAKGNVAAAHIPHPVLLGVSSDPRAPLRRWIETGYWDVRGDYQVHHNWNELYNRVQGTWFAESERVAERIAHVANTHGTHTARLPWSATWKPWKQPPWSDSDDTAELVQADLDRRIAHWRVLNLRDLLDAFRLAPHLVTTLQRHTANSLQHVARNPNTTQGTHNYYIGCYDQVYVVLEFEGGDKINDATDDQGRSNRSKLRALLAPTCLRADSAEEAEQRTATFWAQVRQDAGCADYTDYS
ncbi:hypothetical protein GNI_182890, partial [Gregarina niphandrodes]